MDIIDQYAERDGPLPKRGFGNVAVAFWRGYDQGEAVPPAGRGQPGSAVARAFDAGLKRRQVEPGLTDAP